MWSSLKVRSFEMSSGLSRFQHQDPKHVCRVYGTFGSPTVPLKFTVKLMELGDAGTIRTYSIFWQILHLQNQLLFHLVARLMLIVRNEHIFTATVKAAILDTTNVQTCPWGKCFLKIKRYKEIPMKSITVKSSWQFKLKWVTLLCYIESTVMYSIVLHHPNTSHPSLCASIEYLLNYACFGLPS